MDKQANEIMRSDLAVVRRILTASYTVAEGKQANSIRCTSRTGIDDDTEGPFNKVMDAFRQHFGERLLEVYNNVCYRNTDFIIYLR